MKLLDYLVRPFGRITHVWSISQKVSKFLISKEEILDFGAGDCQLAEYLIKNYHFNITPIDVVDYNKTPLKLVIYNGDKIPFPNNSFDAVLIIFVFHHIDFTRQEKILQELKRISRSKIIIVEDTPLNFIEKIFWRFWDWLLNLGHGVKMTYSVRKEKDWERLFKKYNLKIKVKENFRPWLPVLGMYQQTMFVLEKDS